MEVAAGLSVLQEGRGYMAWGPEQGSSCPHPSLGYKERCSAQRRNYCCAAWVSQTLSTTPVTPENTSPFASPEAKRDRQGKPGP